MSNVSVFLSTTGRSFNGDEAIRHGNVPVCVVHMGLGMFGFGPELERMESFFASTLQSMAKDVEIDVEKKTLFIGMADTRTAMVEYEEKGEGREAAQEFFSRWNVTKTLVLEFAIFAETLEPQSNLKPRFVFRGFHVDGTWRSQDIVTHPMFIPVGGGI